MTASFVDALLQQAVGKWETRAVFQGDEVAVSSTAFFPARFAGIPPASGIPTRCVAIPACTFVRRNPDHEEKFPKDSGKSRAVDAQNRVEPERGGNEVPSMEQV